MMNIYLLHGFLGKPSDWIIFEKYLSEYSKDSSNKINIIKPDLYTEIELSAFRKWARLFNRKVSTKNSGQENILIGYSLGGRLATEIFLSEPSIWSQVHLISSQFGLKTQTERLNRLKNDKRWAERFSEEPFVRVIEDWNKQPVFTSSAEAERLESEYDRKKLVWILQNWSLARHEDLYEELRKWSQSDSKSGKNRLNWYCGERDLKYLQLKKEIELECPFIKTATIPESGHRVLFDQTQSLAEVISQALFKV